MSTVEDLKEVETKIKELQDNKLSLIKNYESLKSELGFQTVITLTGAFCEYLPEGWYIEYRYASYNNREYCVNNDKKETKIELTTTHNEKGDIVDIKIKVPYSYHESNESIMERYITAGKICDAILNKKEETYNFVNSFNPELKEEIISYDRKIKESGENIKQFKTFHKEEAFKIFVNDLKEGVDFEHNRYFQKTNTFQIRLNKFKITHYSPSGKTVYFKFYSKYNSYAGVEHSEASAGRVYEFFESVYNNTGGKIEDLKSVYTTWKEESIKL